MYNHVMRHWEYGQERFGGTNYNTAQEKCDSEAENKQHMHLF